MVIGLLRKISSPSPPRKITSPISGKVLEITTEDIRLIQTSWRKEFNSNPKIGISIFCSVLSKKPELCEIFKIPTATDDSTNEDEVVDGSQVVTVIKINSDPTELESIKEVREHGDRIVMFLNKVTQYIGTRMCATSLIPFIRKIGVMHCRIRHVRFEAQYWLLFKRSILDNITGVDNLSDKTFLAWNKLLTFVISEMKDAFYAGVLCNIWPEPEHSDVYV